MWTAYPIERQHTEEKLLKEYEDYKKATTVPFKLINTE